jgi:Uma2 family endonuclease
MTTEVLTEKKYYTIEDFEALPDEGKRYELVDGELIEKGATGVAGANEQHVRVGARLLIHLGSYVLQNNLGETYGSDARFAVIPPVPPSIRPTVRQCDVSFVSTERVTRGVFTMPYAPDLAVEIISEGNDFIEIEKKTREYRNAGAKLVWVIEPEDKLVHIYRAGSNQRQTSTINDELDGETVIPGFKLKISLLFD